MYHQFRSPASHSPIPRTGVYCPGTAPTGGWFHDLLPTQSWEEEEDGGVRPPVQPPQWTNQTSAAIAKNLKFHPATSSTFATGAARRPLGRAARTRPRGYPSRNTPAGRGDRPRQTKRTRQLIPLETKTNKKNNKTTYTTRKKNQKHQTVKNSTILPCTLHYLS